MAEREKVVKALKESIDFFTDRIYGDKCDVWLKASYDAIALLKAQEPRVMMLDEVRESIEHDKRISVYLQQKDGICREPRPALYTNLYGEGIDLRLGVDYVDYGGWLEQIVLYTKEYLKTWCLWTSRPTDEQREKEPWNG